MVRYNNQTLLDWLQSFVPPLNKFLKAASQQTLDNEKLKTLCKDHVVNQITLSEKLTMLIFQRQRLTDAEIQQIQYLNEAEFNEKTLQKLVTKLSSKLWAMQTR